MRFSQKIGKTPIREAIQIESIDKRLENRLWNTILNDFFDKLSEFKSTTSGEDSQKAQVCGVIWKEFFGERADEIESLSNGNIYSQGVINYIKNWFFKAQWFEKYDFVEFLSRFDSILQFGFADDCKEDKKDKMIAPHWLKHLS